MTHYKLYDTTGYLVGTVAPYGGNNWGGLQFCPAGVGGRKSKSVEGAIKPEQTFPGWAKKIITRIEPYTV